MDTRVIAKMYVPYGRMGNLEGIFICTQAELESLHRKTVYFGEVLGKHSEVVVRFDKNDLKVMTDDQEFIDKFVEIMGDGTISGYNPLDYLDEEELDESEEV